MSCDLPKLSKVYQNHHINSTRWEKFSPRKDDIFIVVLSGQVQHGYKM